jgi:8-oxo-dGTP pyrophosphatase MutT (NUDIX family)
MSLELDLALRERVAKHLAEFPREKIWDSGLRRAAVALALTSDDTGAACFFLTRRAAGLRNHGGQWSLPGGRLDAGETPQACARRELHEELGLELGDDSVLGLLDDYPTRSGFAMTPVVVWAGAARELAPDPGEVEHVYRVPVSELLRPDVPSIHYIPQSERPLLSIPLLGVSLHAPTAAIVFQLREVALFGRATRVAHYDQPRFAWR